MNVLEPVTDHVPSGRGTARVAMPARSLPVPGSVMAMAPIVVPATIRGSQRARCSSLPYFRMYGATMSECNGKHGPLAPARASSSMTIAP